VQVFDIRRINFQRIVHKTITHFKAYTKSMGASRLKSKLISLILLQRIKRKTMKKN